MFLVLKFRELNISLAAFYRLYNVERTAICRWAIKYDNKGEVADLALVSLDDEWVVDPNDFVSMGKSTPFEGWKLKGKNLMTICKGEIVYEAL